MIQKILIVKGRVQDKNYREAVKEIASQLNIFGRVRNIVNGNNTVEILCQCNDDDHFQEFKKTILIKSDKKYEPNVEGIEEIDINPPKIILKTFTVEYGNKQEELIKKLNIGIQVMSVMNNNMSTMNTEIKSMNENMTNRFDDMDRKYGSIGDSLKELVNIFKNDYEVILKPKKKKK